jgi:hypothetical protein
VCLDIFGKSNAKNFVVVDPSIPQRKKRSIARYVCARHRLIANLNTGILRPSKCVPQALLYAHAPDFGSTRSRQFWQCGAAFARRLDTRNPLTYPYFRGERDEARINVARQIGVP